MSNKLLGGVIMTKKYKIKSKKMIKCESKDFSLWIKFTTI